MASNLNDDPGIDDYLQLLCLRGCLQFVAHIFYKENQREIRSSQIYKFGVSALVLKMLSYFHFNIKKAFKQLPLSVFSFSHRASQKSIKKNYFPSFVIFYIKMY